MKRSVRLPIVLGAVLVAFAAVVLVPVSLAGAASPPSAPVGVHASNSAGEALVSWSRPLSNGGAAITSYMVKSRPLNRVCVSKTSTCIVTHLTPDVSYTFSVIARGAGGASVSSPPSNRVRIPGAGNNYLAAVAAFNDSVATDQVAINNLINSNASAAQLNKVLSKLTATYTSFRTTLAYDEWPAKARAGVASLIADVNTVSVDTIDAYGASAPTAGAVADALDGADNKELEADAQVRTDLGLSQVIISPITTTPTPTAVGSPVVLHDFAGDELSVTASQIIDPATAGAGSGLANAGYRFVAVVLNLSDVTGGSITGDANYSTSVIGTDGQTYTADFGSVAECTNFSYGIFQLAGTDTVSGCVVFQLPTAVSVATVDFSMAPGYLDSAVWTN
ncbi:MAG: fibronectin type III domain-containing protein [Acidimicrobiales bacterium]